MNVYHTLVGCANVIAQLSIVYLAGLLALLVQPFKLYVIVYVIIFQFTYTVATASQLFKLTHANPVAIYELPAWL